MAFGFFKKKEFAETIFRNGTIYTMDSELPIVESLACKDGIIIALGDESTVAQLAGEDTEIVDLDGDTMLAGFIDEHGTPVAKAFQESYAELSEAMTTRDILLSIKTYVSKNKSEEHYLAYGYNENVIVQDELLEFRKALDGICSTKPLVMIASDGLHMILNTFAGEIVLARAEEMEITTITPALVMDTLVPFDYEALAVKIFRDAFKAASCGYTSIFNVPTLSFFDNIYRDLLVDAYQNDMLKQRYFGSLLLNRPLSDRLISHSMAQKHTACAELDNRINFDTLYIVCSGSKENPSYMSADYLGNVCDIAADKGYNIRIAAIDKEAALTSLEILGSIKAAYKKPAFSIEHDQEITEDERSQIMTSSIPEYSAGDRALKPQTAEEAILKLTVVAADNMGLSSVCGSLEKGKWADFAIFKNDPFKMSSASEFLKCKATMTVIGGKIVYDSAEDSSDKWARKIIGQLNSIDEDLSL